MIPGEPRTPQEGFDQAKARFSCDHSDWYPTLKKQPCYCKRPGCVRTDTGTSNDICPHWEEDWGGKYTAIPSLEDLRTQKRDLVRHATELINGLMDQCCALLGHHFREYEYREADVVINARLCYRCGELDYLRSQRPKP